jgi:transcription-repair coupling factor (superfamily II helicase)
MALSSMERVLICSIIPYFLERENFWFEENLRKILEARKTQIFWQENTLFLERDLKIPFSFLLRKLDEMGYEKVWEVSEIGEFSQRGGIVDVFPINLSFAIRIEFFGNKIENIFKLPLEIKDEKREKEILKKKLKSQKIFSDLKGLKIGDYLVHLDHGVGKFLGYYTFRDREKCGTKYYLIEYAKGDRLYVPLGLERKLSRYIGFAEPKISRLGTLSWQRTKKKVKEEAIKLAKELLEIYAKREIAKRNPYLPENEIDLALKNSFQFEETPDQIKALKDIEEDFKKEKPMDRIVCGDVGFGKTEIALRAMVRAVNSGYQAVLICPTTILANQHYQNFKRRLKNLPIKIAMLSRLQKKDEQRRTIKNLKEGKIDILVGTHRILSKDVAFKNLGLLVIDDEHRFGVEQKEKLKKMKSSIDVLSLSATPIPRTLYLALSSLKDISLIQTPPEGRLPIKTFILKFSKEKIKEAIENELKRGGQIYFLHNRIETLKKVKEFLEKLVPKIKIGIAHGRQREKELVKVMEDFQNKRIDLLLATTIIEAGLDFPNVNTLIVDDATKLGLAEAYQIRGRIGRSFIQAFAYFFYPSRLVGKARLRLKALKEAEELGSGYKIALKDLEIRGAGNILGKEQSGNINKVGLNLYCQMLSQAIEKLKKRP